MHTYPLLNRETLLRLLRERFDSPLLGLGDLPDPSAFKDMDRAVERIVRAIRKRERIILIGDYDVDGVVATSVMRLFFDEIGSSLEWIIPNRFRDGYGLSPTVLERIDSADLILTVDNGISALDAARICRERGIDLIITDHHIVPETPPDAYAIVDQKQPECTFPHEEVCGAQIAWYLCAALRRELGAKVDMRAYLEYVALAVIADIMPLQHINRAMVESGLRQLARSRRPYVRAYREATGKESFSAEEIAFGLAPILNSAGRMEDASIACDYLCAPNIYEARSLLTTLQGFNERRKSMEREITEEAMATVQGDPAVIVAAGEDWHEGVLGIVAARLARHYRRPALVLTATENGYKGSGRSFGDCDLFALVDGAREYLDKFGGHKAAVGLSLRAEALEPFRRALEHSGEKCRRAEYRDPDLLGILPLEEIDWELYRAMEAFEPFGHGNPRPKFIVRDARIANVRKLGAEGEHLKFLFEAGAGTVEGIAFRTQGEYRSGESIDLICTLGENRFNGRSTLQLLIEEILR